MVLGAITPNDCDDIPDTTTLSEKFGSTAVPRVSGTQSSGSSSGRT
ncbi:unnamed protein product, partial [Rotaria magnacalcarata]